MTLQSLRILKRRFCISRFNQKGCKSPVQPPVSVDSCGIPLAPSWSVNKLLSSYPSPTLRNETVTKLYQLSALIQPKQGTPQYRTVKKSLEEMIRLVEAVRLVDTTGVLVRGQKAKEDADRETLCLVSETGGGSLLEHACRTHNGFYVVDSERTPLAFGEMIQKIKRTVGSSLDCIASRK